MSYEIRTRAVRRGGKIVHVPYGGLGLSLNPLTLATAIQSGADKIQSNLQQAASWLTTEASGISSVANRVGAGVQGAAQGGIAAAGTGNASTGLTLAALTSSPVVFIGGVLLAVLVFTRHPGHRGL